MIRRVSITISSGNTHVFTFLMRPRARFSRAVEKVAAMRACRCRRAAARARRATSGAVLARRLVLRAEIFETTLNPRRAKARGYLADRGVDPARTFVRPRLRCGDRFVCARRWRREASTCGNVAAGLLAHGDDVAVAYDASATG